MLSRLRFTSLCMRVHLALHAGILLRPTLLDGMPSGQERSAAAILVDWKTGLLQVGGAQHCSMKGN